MLHHVTIRLCYRSRKSTPSWASDDEEGWTEVQRNIGGNVGQSRASPNNSRLIEESQEAVQHIYIEKVAILKHPTFLSQNSTLPRQFLTINF